MNPSHDRQRGCARVFLNAAAVALLGSGVSLAATPDLDAIRRRSSRSTMRPSSGCRTGSRCRRSPPRTCNFPRRRRVHGASWRARPASSRSRSSTTDGKPGVFATLDAGAPKTVGLYFMYDVKQFDPAEWTLAAAGGAHRRQARRRQGDDGPRRGQPEGAGGGVARRAARDPRRRPEDAGEPRAGRRGRGGDRLAAHRPARPSPRGRGRAAQDASACSCPRRRRTSTASSRSASAPRASSSSSWSRAARSGAAARRKDIHSSLKAMVDSPAWRLVKALDTLVSDDGNTITIDGYPKPRRRSAPRRRR